MHKLMFAIIAFALMIAVPIAPSMAADSGYMVAAVESGSSTPAALAANIREPDRPHSAAGGDHVSYSNHTENVPAFRAVPFEVGWRYSSIA